jgi:nucleoside-diphosphate-sugar epimerase
VTFRIGITGGSSGIGRALAEMLTISGFEVILIGRRKILDSIQFDLSDFSDFPVLDSIDLLIHLAWYRSNSPDNDYQVNVDAGRRLLIQADMANCLPILVSSDSAEQANSMYGAAKRELEVLFTRCGGSALRCGLVTGAQKGGILTSIQTLSNLRLFCLHLKPEPGLRFTRVSELFELIQSVAADYSLRGQVLQVGAPTKFSLSQIAHVMRKKHTLLHLSFPINLALLLMAIPEAMRLDVGFKRDSLRSFYSPQTSEPFGISDIFSADIPEDILKYLKQY